MSEQPESLEKLRARLDSTCFGVTRMDKSSLLQEAQQRLSELLRSSPAADIERNLKAFMAQTFQRMDLITRDEFDVFESRLEHLQSRILELEARLAARSSVPGSDGSGASGSGPSVAPRD